MFVFKVEKSSKIVNIGESLLIRRYAHVDLLQVVRLIQVFEVERNEVRFVIPLQFQVLATVPAVA